MPGMWYPQTIGKAAFSPEAEDAITVAISVGRISPFSRNSFPRLLTILAFSCECLALSTYGRSSGDSST